MAEENVEARAESALSLSESSHTQQQYVYNCLPLTYMS